MAERLKKIPKQLLDIWNKYTKTQKTLIISVSCVVIFAFALLIILMKKVDYTQIMVCENTKEASQVTQLLKEQSIRYKVGKDQLTISVDSKKTTDAVFLLADSDISKIGRAHV